MRFAAETICFHLMHHWEIYYHMNALRRPVLPELAEANYQKISTIPNPNANLPSFVLYHQCSSVPGMHLWSAGWSHRHLSSSESYHPPYNWPWNLDEWCLSIREGETNQLTPLRLGLTETLRYIIKILGLLIHGQLWWYNISKNCPACWEKFVDFNAVSFLLTNNIPRRAHGKPVKAKYWSMTACLTHKRSAGYALEIKHVCKQMALDWS